MVLTFDLLSVLECSYALLTDEMCGHGYILVIHCSVNYFTIWYFGDILFR